MPEWSKYAVGRPSTNPNWTEPRCQPLRWVYHIAHLETARRILSDGIIRAGLVFDKSRMNTERVRVVWLSPNTWYRGFRYGNVSFAFAWPDVLQNFRAYWVEVMTDYNPHAPRILLTRQDYSGKLEPYDPTNSHERGPWWLDSASGAHYRNGDYTLEFMLEDDLPLAQASALTFVKHHETFCCLDPQSCPERGLAEDDAASRFVASLPSRGIVVPPGLLTVDEAGTEVPSPALKHAVQSLWGELNAGTLAYGSSSPPVTARPALAKAVLQALATQNKGDLAGLAELYASPDDLCMSVEDVLRVHYRLAPSVDLKWKMWLP